MFGYVYKTMNIINNRVYIGKRKGKEFDPSYYGSGSILKQAIKKYGKENFLVEVLEEADTADRLNELEIYYIKKYQANNLYNIAKGGTGGDTTSFHPSKKDIIQKRANGLKNWHSSLTLEEKKNHNKKISLSKKGKVPNRKGYRHSEKTIAKIKESNKKIKKSEEWYSNHKIAAEARRGVSLIKKYKPIIVNGIEYTSRKEAIEKSGYKHRAYFYKDIKRGLLIVEDKNDI